MAFNEFIKILSDDDLTICLFCDSDFVVDVVKSEIEARKSLLV